MTDTSETQSAAKKMVREAVGNFSSWESLQKAVDELQASGFDRSEISLLAGHEEVEKKLGHIYERVKDLEDDPNVPKIAFVGRDSLVEGKTGVVGGLAYVGALSAIGAVIGSGGTVGAAIAAAALAGGSGGLIGSWVARALGRDRAKALQHQLEKGGLLLWVYVRDAEHERRASEILLGNGAQDVHIHDMAVLKDPESDPLSNVQPDPFLPGART